MKKILTILAVAALFAPASFAQAVLFDFGFVKLDGDYTGNIGGGSFVANASATSLGGPFDSEGDVNRIFPVAGTADFAAGFKALSAFANVNLSLTLSNIDPSSIGATADATGTFTLTDDDGDFITGTLTGQFVRTVTGANIFNGNLTSISVSNSASTFDGTTSGSFGLNFPLSNWVGSSTTLVVAPGVWFDSSFSNARTDFDGAVVVPVPGAVLLGGLGLGLIGRIRRHLAA